MGSSGGGRCCCCEKMCVAFRVLFTNNENSAIAAQLGETTATKTQPARETGVRVVWPTPGRDGRGTTTTADYRLPARAFATSSPRLASAIFAPPPAHQRASTESRVQCTVECPVRARKYNKRTKWPRVAPRSGRSTSRGGSPPTRARGATRLAESPRRSNMSERALSLFLRRTSPRFRTSRVTRQPNQRAQAACRATSRRRSKVNSAIF